MYEPALDKPQTRRINCSMAQDDILVPLNAIFSDRSKVALMKNHLNASNLLGRAQSSRKVSQVVNCPEYGDNEVPVPVMK